jgi:rRNA pseudouridine-1189 N-methylase Emg1 (Nep1/Mra1 family)
MIRPLEILKAIQIINSAKRRGSSTPDSILAQKEVVSLVMPTQIIQQFTTNINNQVIQAGTQELITVQSGSMKDLLEARNVANTLANTQPIQPTNQIPSGPSGIPNVPKLSNRAESSGTSP